MSFFFFATLFFTDAFAIADLPYTQRTQNYNGLSTTVQGDITTVGMSGTTFGLADSVVSSNDNPAGLAMTFSGVALHISGNRFRDGYIQDIDSPMRSRNSGASGGFYPWGFGVGERIAYREGTTYNVGAFRERANLDLLVKEYRISAARVFAGDQIAVGASLLIGTALRRMEFEDQRLGLNQYENSTLGLNLGVLAKLESKLLVGAAYTTEMNYEENTGIDPMLGVTGFGQAVKTPPRLGFGVGWIPNRFFKAGLSIIGTGIVQNTALLRDDNTSVGTRATLQPRIGFKYHWLDFRELTISAYTGSYFEMTRIENAPNRLHWTGGLEVEPWILNLGWAFDRALDYRNMLFSAGINLIKLARKLNVISLPQPDPGGIFPHPFRYSDQGLPRALVKEWRPQGPERPADFINTAKDAAISIKEEFKNPLNPIQRLGKDALDSVKSVGEDINENLSSD